MEEAVAKEVVAEEAPPTKENLVDRAAMEFKFMMPVFKRFIASLSNKAKDRVVNAIIEYPLFDKDPVFQNSKERDLFDIGIRLLDAKTAMVQYAYEEKLKQGIEETTKNTQEKETVVNG